MTRTPNPRQPRAYDYDINVFHDRCVNRRKRPGSGRNGHSYRAAKAHLISFSVYPSDTLTPPTSLPSPLVRMLTRPLPYRLPDCLKVTGFALLRATSVFSVPQWFVLQEFINYRGTEDTEFARRNQLERLFKGKASTSITWHSAGYAEHT
jgi:hypothetical protein